MENESIPGTIKEMEKVRDNAIQAFHFAKGQVPKTENLKSAVLAKQLVILAEILIHSYNNTMIIPFSQLDEQKKQTMEDEVGSMQLFHESQKVPMFTWNKVDREIQEEARHHDSWPQNGHFY